MGSRFGKGSLSSGFGQPATTFGSSDSADVRSDLCYWARPADVSSISDPAVVICFKSVQKKDETTKVRALEELLAYVIAHPHEKDGGLEDAILDAWATIFTRLIYDNSHRVRELTATIMGAIVSSARQRVNHRFNHILAPWYSASGDAVASVAKAAQLSMIKLIETPEKHIAFATKIQKAVLLFVQAALLETRETLSDERVTTLEDMDSKYFRVLHASLSLVCALLRRVDAKARAAATQEYMQVLESDIIWPSINCVDTTVHRAACTLFSLSAQYFPDALKKQKSAIKKIFINDGLKVNHRIGVIMYLECLVSFTDVHGNSVWLPSDKGGKPPLSRLGTFVEKGSGNGNNQFWEQLDRLLFRVPDEAWTLTSALKFTGSFRKGMATREDRILVATPWACYNRLCERFVKILTKDPEELQEFAKKTMVPVLETALGPVLEANEWMIHGPPYDILTQMFTIFVNSPILEPTLSNLLEKIASSMRTTIASSLPSISAGYMDSQQTVSVWGRRWFSFSGEVRKSPAFRDPIKLTLDTLDLDLVERCIEVLLTRNLHPFGAAQVLRHALENTELLKSDIPGLVLFLIKAGTEMLPHLLRSRVDAEVISILHSLNSADAKEHAQYDSIWEAWMKALLALSDDTELKTSLFSFLMKLASTEKSRIMAQKQPGLSDILVKRCLEVATSTRLEDRTSLSEILRSKVLTTPITVGLLHRMLDMLVDSPMEFSLQYDTYDRIAASDPASLMSDHDLAVRFNLQLLALAEIGPESIGSKAINLHISLRKRDHGAILPAIIQSSLITASPKSLGIKSLSKLGYETILADPTAIGPYLPPLDVWISEIKRLVNNIGVDPMLAITSPLGGAQFLIDSGIGEEMVVERDSFGRSVPARMALYLVMILEYAPLSIAHYPILIDLLLVLATTLEIVTDQVALMEEDQLMALPDARSTTFITTTDAIIARLLKDQPWEVIQSLVGASVVCTQGEDAYSFYRARGLYTCLKHMSAPTTAQVDDLFTTFGVNSPMPQKILLFVTLTAVFRGYLVASKHTETLCNRLIAEVQGLKTANSPKILLNLAALSHTLNVYEVGMAPIPQNRIMFALRMLVPIAGTDTTTPEVRGEIFRVLMNILPNVSSMFGPHWNETLEALVDFWERDSAIYFDVLNAMDPSLRLYRVLRDLEEPAEELTEGLVDIKERADQALLNLLFAEREVECRPQYLVDKSLREFLVMIPQVDHERLERLEALLMAEARSVQIMSLEMIRRALPTLQEDMIADTILEKKTATIPNPIWENITNCPQAEFFSDEDLDTFPTRIRQYLYAWLVIFDMYEPVPIAIRIDYTQALREADVGRDLFDLMFFILGHSTGHPVNLEKAHITSDMLAKYDLETGEAEDQEKNMNWLLAHLYFQALKFIPEIFRRWFIDTKSKATKKAVDDWTSSYISAPIIEAVLDEVSKWAEQQEKDAMDDDVALSVRVSRAAWEVTAGYEVDESEATIQVRIPKNFPLGNVEVEGTNRVGVSDKQWNTWMRLVQGVITFSNGSIIDGLIVYRRNMSGVLKGQSECAICYAIVGEDKQMPNKKCGTCQKLFHKGCLYKWFQTSSQNTCPLCRNPIDYLGSDTQDRRRRAQQHEF